MANSNRAAGTETIHVAIVPLDATDLSPLQIRSIVCLTAGTIVMQDSAGTNISYPMTAGQVLNFGPKRVMTATTGTYAGWR